MKQKLQILFILFTTILYSVNIFAQANIDYTAATNLSSACNVFAPPINVGGRTHHSFAGGVSWSATGIYLSTTPQGATPGGTAYYIDHNFLPGIPYTISIEVSGGNSALILNTSVVQSLGGYISAGNASCIPDPNVTNYAIAGYGIMSTATTPPAGTPTAPHTYTIPAFTVPSSPFGYDFLLIWASHGNAGLALDGLRIRKITITVPPAFTIPAMPLLCGDATAKTFTVTNTNGTPGVTYDWDLGSTTNGWLYNGLAAPRFITAQTSNSLILTPNTCGSVNQTNVSVTVKINGTIYTTLNSAVVLTDPPLSMAGPASVCSSPTAFLINNLPCRANVVWTYTHTGPASINMTYPIPKQVSVTAGVSGNVTLTATVTNMCVATSPIAISKALRVGIYNGPAETPITVSYTPTCKNKDIDFRISAVPGATNYTWTKPSGWTGSIIHNITYRAVTGNTAGTFPVSITVTNSCGAGIPAVVNVVVNNCSRIADPLQKLEIDELIKPENTAKTTFAQATIFPNPSSNIITIFIPAKKINENKTVINIFDMSGNRIRRIKPTSSTTEIDVSSFSAGTYSFQLFDGEKITTKKIIKQ